MPVSGEVSAAGALAGREAAGSRRQASEVRTGLGRAAANPAIDEALRHAVRFSHLSAPIVRLMSHHTQEERVEVEAFCRVILRFNVMVDAFEFV